ncbi:alpha-1,2-fucosyltransferase [Chitinophaga sp. 22321]|uniref:Alpha-1,2-fucosyltransferase n=1 Tax=Chitinophaga hostae TaxID=2831022 RepID=A0ABS5J124_9BACT|nr:alpha-1,2-fucosyltransferase [Chitinophaga hostae]MBS0028137.1 alpha-1,2-fucosyltransferase [Chitinophaga hostae]
MIVVKIKEGLGNQMFQFAFAIKYILAKKHVKLDTSFYVQYQSRNGFELSRIFQHIDIAIAGRRDFFFFLKKAKRENGRSHYVLRENRLIYQESKETEFTYNQYLSLLDNVFFNGYWQNINYFSEWRTEVAYYFRFPPIPDSEQENKEIAHAISSSNAVSIHIRRGDYLASTFHRNLGIDYYLQAISVIKAQVENPQFFVFSDDPEWAEKEIKEENMVFVNNNVGSYSYRDMQLMSLCKHNIIANSTFSWWGAWLNNNEKKIVVSPQTWFNAPIPMDVLLLKEWIKI